MHCWPLPLSSPPAWQRILWNLMDIPYYIASLSQSAPTGAECRSIWLRWRLLRARGGTPDNVNEKPCTAPEFQSMEAARHTSFSITKRTLPSSTSCSWPGERVPCSQLFHTRIRTRLLGFSTFIRYLRVDVVLGSFFPKFYSFQRFGAVCNSHHDI